MQIRSCTEVPSLSAVPAPAGDNLVATRIPIRSGRALHAREQLTPSYHDPVARGPGGVLVMWLPKIGRQTSSGTTHPLLFMCSDIWLSSEPSGRHSNSTLHELC